MHILIVDDERNILRTTSLALNGMGHKTEVAENGRQAMRAVRGHKLDAVFLDLRLGHENGLDVLDQIVAEDEGLPVIVFTAYSTIESAVDAMRRGAYDYISKPFIPEQIRQMLQKLENNRRLQNKVTALESQLAEDNPAIDLTSNEESMRKAYDISFRAASSEASILLLGPSGTGKSVLARNIHSRSQRKEQPFVTINCPSLSKELLESELFGHVKGAFTGATGETWGKVTAADGGTLFLDEIGEMPLEIQPKLLRLLQDREYERVGETKTRTADIRLIAATNRDLAQCVREGTFREDLYYRLNVISIDLPALNHRPGDILPLAEKYLDFFRQRMGKPDTRFAEETRKAFIDYEWPGNLRELRNVIERSVILAAGEEITLADLPEDFHEREESAIRPGYEVTLDELEQEHIRRILAKADSLEEAARILGIDTATLYRKRKRMGLLSK